MSEIKSVAVVGAGASGAVTASALDAEGYFDRIRVFERRETPGGTWIYDPDPGPAFHISPGRIPPEIDPPLEIPSKIPSTTSPSTQERYAKTPIYSNLTTNVPDIAMSFSDQPFAYGPFTPHWVPKEYLESYFSTHRIDRYLVSNTTVEDISKLPASNGLDRWSLTLRRFNPVKHVDEWWKEEFDAVVLANGHYSIPYIPRVEGLEDYAVKYPGRVIHSKQYRSAEDFIDKKVIVIGNSASGHDVTTALVETARLPVYQSRRSASRWDGDEPPSGVAWKPVISKFLPSGEIVFGDGSVLSDIDIIVYCTGYKASFPFWNPTNGPPLYNYAEDRLNGSYLHTFFRDFPTLVIVGLPRVLTFRSMEYQAIAIARIWSGRNAVALPSRELQIAWEENRENLTRRERRKFHDIQWDDGETMQYLQALYEIAGLPTLDGAGRYPPVLNEKTRWAIENIKKYPEPGKTTQTDGFTLISHGMMKDSLHFI